MTRRGFFQRIAAAIAARFFPKPVVEQAARSHGLTSNRVGKIGDTIRIPKPVRFVHHMKRIDVLYGFSLTENREVLVTLER